MKRFATTVSLMFSILFSSALFTKPATPDLSKDVFYQILIRSFYDSNGDGIGDIRGLTQKLDYLQDLGITAIWINPIVESQVYHNYFADDFFKVDPELGTIDDYRNLCTEIHKRGMKILLDMETQYITKNHEWFKKAIEDPKSEYNKFIKWEDRDEEIPLSAISGFTEIASYNGDRVGVMTVNLHEKKVFEYQKKIFAFWIDPNGDGNFTDGADGYRMDHIMDDLDNKGIFTGLLNSFWRPIVEYTRKIKPDIIYLTEPAEWSSKWDTTLGATEMDAAFNVPLRSAIASLSKDNVIESGINDVNSGRSGKFSFTIIENHDVNRFASEVSSDPAALRLGAVLNMTLPGVPCLYYGQELGIRGEKIEGGNDGNDIPMREAFRWFKDWKKKGMAVWYKISDNPDTEDEEGVFWTNAYVKNNDGTTLEEQINNPKSLYSFYKKLISIRKLTDALSHGKTKVIPINDENLLAFTRSSKDSVTVFINFSKEEKEIKINLKGSGITPGEHTDLISGLPVTVKDETAFTSTLKGYQTMIIK